MKKLLITSIVVICFLTDSLATAAQNQLKTKYAIFMTADGLRHEELFGDVDEILINNKKKPVPSNSISKKSI
jgi:hypothetical protein